MKLTKTYLKLSRKVRIVVFLSSASVLLALSERIVFFCVVCDVWERMGNGFNFFSAPLLFYE